MCSATNGIALGDPHQLPGPVGGTPMPCHAMQVSLLTPDHRGSDNKCFASSGIALGDPYKPRKVLTHSRRNTCFSRQT